MKKLDIRGFSHELLLVAFVAVFAIGGVAYIVASHAQTPCIASTLKYGNHKTKSGLYYGSKGNCVKYAQQLANWKLVVNPKLQVNGYYDKNTQTAIETIRQQYAFPANGNYGRVTFNVWRTLCSTTTAPGKGGPFYGDALIAYQKAGCFYLAQPVSGSTSGPASSPTSSAAKKSTI
jgi:hypothetical protein